MSRIDVGIIGFGTVGAGTFEVLSTNREIIRNRVGAEICVKKIADLDIESDRGVDVPAGILTREAEEILDDPEIAVVVELIGGLGKAKEYILKAMEKGKHVVTANKALLAEQGREIYRAAEENNVSLCFEASVGGGIPIIETMKCGLASNRVLNAMGILNGTSNYILTRISREGLSYDQVVHDAVDLGFAEDPPTLDVDGTDAAHKLAILMSMVFGAPVAYKDIYKEGITHLTPEDIRFAEEFGYSVKLLAIARHVGSHLEARVHPTMIPRGHILANVNDVYNAIYLEGDFVGPNLYFGLGAGRRPTGSAVTSDIIALARQIRAGIRTLVPPLGYALKLDEETSILPMEELTSSYYFRFSAMDRPGVLSEIAGILGENRISIASVIQMGREVNGSVPVVMLTHEAVERDVRRAVSRLDRLKNLTDKTIMIRVEDG